MLGYLEVMVESTERKSGSGPWSTYINLVSYTFALDFFLFSSSFPPSFPFLGLATNYVGSAAVGAIDGVHSIRFPLPFSTKQFLNEGH